MLSPQSDYRQILKEEFAARTQRNPQFSLRAFAKFLGMPSAQLSDVLNKKYGFSSKRAGLLAKKLGYSDSEEELFCTLVEKEHARSRISRQAAELRLEKFKEKKDFRTLETDAFHAISQWHHFAIVELTRLKNFVSSGRWIAERLGISKIESDLAVERLLRLGLLELKEGKLVPSQIFYSSPHGFPSEAKRKFHAEILKKASQSLLSQPFEKRDISAGVLAIDSSRIGEVREMINQFRCTVDSKLEDSPSKDAVYCLSIQFFEVGVPQNEI